MAAVSPEIRLAKNIVWPVGPIGSAHTIVPYTVVPMYLPEPVRS